MMREVKVGDSIVVYKINGLEVINPKPTKVIGASEAVLTLEDRVRYKVGGLTDSDSQVWRDNPNKDLWEFSEEVTKQVKVGDKVIVTKLNGEKVTNPKVSVVVEAEFGLMTLYEEVNYGLGSSSGSEDLVWINGVNDEWIFAEEDVINDTEEINEEETVRMVDILYKEESANGSHGIILKNVVALLVEPSEDIVSIIMDDEEEAMVKFSEVKSIKTKGVEINYA